MTDPIAAVELIDTTHSRRGENNPCHLVFTTVLHRAHAIVDASTC